MSLAISVIHGYSTWDVIRVHVHVMNVIITY